MMDQLSNQHQRYMNYEILIKCNGAIGIWTYDLRRFFSKIIFKCFQRSRYIDAVFNITTYWNCMCVFAWRLTTSSYDSGNDINSNIVFTTLFAFSTLWYNIVSAIEHTCKKSYNLHPVITLLVCALTCLFPSVHLFNMICSPFYFYSR